MIGSLPVYGRYLGHTHRVSHFYFFLRAVLSWRGGGTSDEKLDTRLPLWTFVFLAVSLWFVACVYGFMLSVLCVFAVLACLSQHNSSTNRYHILNVLNVRFSA